MFFLLIRRYTLSDTLQDKINIYVWDYKQFINVIELYGMDDYRIILIVFFLRLGHVWEMTIVLQKIYHFKIS